MIGPEWEFVEAGRRLCFGTEPVDVPGSLGLEGGIWFRIRQGIRGVLVWNERGVDAAYLICQPASHLLPGHDQKQADAGPHRRADLRILARLAE